MPEPTATPQLRTARFLTLIAILPQFLLLFGTLADGVWAWIAPAAAFAYAAFIFSFLGGYWWGAALTTRPQERVIYVIAVVPALLSFALFLPWICGWNWPGPQLIVLGIAIMASFLVDRGVFGVSHGGPNWFKTRAFASLGLGITTLLIGVIAVQANA